MPRRRPASEISGGGELPPRENLEPEREAIKEKLKKKR
ncbi:hypothetical protein MY3296_005496 [Beauveria thailandica]